MSYGTLEQIRRLMTQIPDTAATDAVLAECLDRATAIIDDALGFSFTGYPATATAKRFSLGGSQYMYLPYYQAGTLTSIAPVLSDLTTDDAYTLADDYEIDDDDHTLLYAPYGWPRQRYEVTAKWGYGEAPAEIVEVCLEMAINLWLGGQGGQYSDVVGVEGGGAVGYQRAFTNRQREIITAVRRKYSQFGSA